LISPLIWTWFSSDYFGGRLGRCIDERGGDDDKGLNSGPGPDGTSDRVSACDQPADPAEMQV
jgi:hypothetical protein